MNITIFQKIISKNYYIRCKKKLPMTRYIKMTPDDKDIRSIRNLARVTFPATYSSIIAAEQIDFMMDMMYSETVLRRELEGGVTFLMLLADGTPAGFVSFGKQDDEGLFHLHKIYLLPDFQGLGYGREMFLKAEHEMRAQGAKAFELNVNRHNKALDFYKKMGMSIDRSGDFDIGGGFYMNDFIMRKEL